MEKKSNNLVYALIAVIVLLLIGAAYLYSSKGKTEKTEPVITLVDPNAANTTPTTNTAPTSTPCADADAFKAEYLAKKAFAETAIKDANAAWGKYQNALELCTESNDVGGKLKVSTSSPKTTTQRSYTSSPGTTTVKSTTVTSGQNVSSNYQAAPARSVSTSVIEGASRKETFCVNLSNMNPDSFWPQKAADNGDQIENSVLNSTADGLNISIYPVAEISGLYGVTKDKRVFILATLLDKYSPDANGIVVGGSPNGWKTWVHAERVGDYYIAQF